MARRSVIAREEGITLMEVSLILIVTLAMLGALAPTLSAVVRRAEETAATNAMNDIRTAVLTAADFDSLDFTTTGSQAGAATRVQLLVSDGDIPTTVSGTGSATWQGVVNTTTGLVDFLEGHLSTNVLILGGAYSFGDWRGAYIAAPVDPDPWGNRYGVNVIYLGGGGAGANDVVVYSAGPDEEIDTQFTANPLAAGDDDLIVLVEA